MDAGGHLRRRLAARGIYDDAPGEQLFPIAFDSSISLLKYFL